MKVPTHCNQESLLRSMSVHRGLNGRASLTENQLRYRKGLRAVGGGCAKVDTSYILIAVLIGDDD